MVWWTWILLWVALVALSLLFLAWLAWRLFRGFSALMAELARAGEALSPSFDADVPQTPREFTPAIFKSPSKVKVSNASNSRLRRWARLERRVRRRTVRSQPQLLRDMPHL